MPSKTTKTTDALRQVPLFSSFSDGELALIASSVTQATYPKGNIIFHEADDGDSLLVVLTGRVKVALFGDDGQEITLTTLGPGNFFGEMSLLENAPRSATVVTTERSTLLHLPRVTFHELLRSHKSLVMKLLLTNMAKRIRATDEQIRTLAMYDVYGRTIRCLIRLGREQGIRTKDGIVLKNRPTYPELASMIGSTRESVTRAIKALQEKRYVTATRRDIVLTTRALEAYWPSA